MPRLAPVLVLAALAIAGPAAAQQQIFRSVDAQPGRQLRLTIAGNVGQDCKPGIPVEIKVLTPPKNGALVVRSGETPAGQLKRCPGLKVPVQAVFYQAKNGYSGPDEVSYEVRRDGKVTTEVVRITVTDKPKAPAKDDAVNL